MVVFAFVFVFSLTLPTNLLAAGPSAINLGSAGNFVILSKTGISTTGSTSVTGDIGVSPISASAITGFALTLPAASAFSTSALVTGKVYASDYAAPTPANLTTAVGDMQTAFTDAMGRAPTVTELGAGNIGGLTLAPGVYKWGTGVTIPTNITLSGSANDVWIFQIAQTLTVSSGTHIILSGGAQASNIFWTVAGQTTLGTTAVFNGNILDQTAIVLNTGATLNGRALAQTAVTLDSNAVTIPNYAAPIVVPPAPTYVPPANSAPIDTSLNPNVNHLIANTPVVIPGCNGNTGFSITTGVSCANNISNFVAPLSVVATYNFGLIDLTNGSKGSAVMDLQRFLNAKLNIGLVVDGDMGPKTILGVKTWQLQNNLVADGMVGPKTKASMYTSR